MGDTRLLLLCIMKDHAQGVALTAQNRAHAVAEVGAVVATRSLCRTVSSAYDNRVALLQTNCVTDRLSAWPLFHQQQFASGEFEFVLAQAENHLEGKYDFAVNVLMQTIEISCSIAKQQRSRTGLAMSVTLLKEARQTVREFSG